MQNRQPTTARPQPRLALLDDTCQRPAIRQLVMHMEQAGITTETATSTGGLYRILLGQPIAVVLVDAAALDEGGVPMVRSLRQATDIGIIARLDAAGPGPTDVVEWGADAWVDDRITPAGAVATVRSLMRRMESDRYAPTPSEPPASMPTLGWRMDSAGWCLLTPDEQAIALTASERAVLSVLMEAGGTPLSRSDLMRALSDNEPGDARRRLEMLVFRLRRKVMDRTGLPLPLLTARGNGYLFLDTHAQRHGGASTTFAL